MRFVTDFALSDTESNGSCSIAEVKPCWAGLVLGWVKLKINLVVGKKKTWKTETCFDFVRFIVSRKAIPYFFSV